jgi:hypothetical protein
MAYIGNTVQNQGFAPAIDYFNGNGVTVTFTLSRPIASVAQVIVAIDNVIQNPSSAFNVVGNSITFTSAPLSGTNNIWVEYTSLITTYQGISQDPTVIGDIRATGGYLSEGDFGNSFVDGAILDYVTGAGRVTVGELDDLIFYHGGTAGRSEMMKVSYAGNSTLAGNLSVSGEVLIGTTALPSAAGALLTVSGASAAYTQYNKGTNGGGVVGSEGTGLVFYTYTGNIGSETYTERMRIDSSGYVTKPYQVAFHVRVNNGAYITTSPVPFSNAPYNIGGAWNTSTYTFTAPVAGRYMFLLQWYGRTTASNQGSTMKLVVNSTQVAYSDMSPSSSATVYLSLPFLSILNLSVGDTVQYTWSGIGAYYGGNQETNLFGYLLG